MPPAYPGPAYRIVTDRLVIRCYSPADAPLLKTAIDESREHLRSWLIWAEGESVELQVEINLLRSFRAAFDEDRDYIYGIFNPEETRCLGGTGLHTRLGPGVLEIGYWIHKDYINRGFATEASAALTRVAFEIHEVNRMEIHCDPANLPSASIPRKLGYTKDAVLRQRIPLSDGTYRDAMIWSLLKSEYPTSPSASAEIQAFDALGRCILS